MSDTNLTPAEIEVLRHLVGGHSTKAVARALGISPRTVESHRLNLRRKADAGHGLRPLVLLARSIGVVAA